MVWLNFEVWHEQIQRLETASKIWTLIFVLNSSPKELQSQRNTTSWNFYLLLFFVEISVFSLFKNQNEHLLDVEACIFCVSFSSMSALCGLICDIHV